MESRVGKTGKGSCSRLSGNRVNLCVAEGGGGCEEEGVKGL